MSTDMTLPKLMDVPSWPADVPELDDLFADLDRQDGEDSSARSDELVVVQAKASVFVIAVPYEVDSVWLRDLIGRGLAGSVIPAPAPAPVPPKAQALEPAGNLEAGSIRMDLDLVRVSVAGREITLTHQEFLLLKVLMQHPGRVLSRKQLLNLAWDNVDYETGRVGRTVDVHVRRLRTKLEPEAYRICTVHGFGYRFDAGHEAQRANLSVVKD